MRLFDLFQTLSEDIIKPGGIAIVFHRTKSIANVNAIRDNGFQIGPSAMYGAGIYTTYSLESQMNNLMSETYGDYIIKSKVSTDGFLNFDDPNIFEQVKKLGITDLEPRKFTSQMALYCLNQKPNLPKLVPGIIYTGSRDGECLVAYNPKLVFPMAYTNAEMDYDTDDEGRTIAIEPELEWKKIINPNLVKQNISPSPSSGFKPKTKEEYATWQLFQKTDPVKFFEFFYPKVAHLKIPYVVNGNLDLKGKDIQSLPDGLMVKRTLYLCGCSLKKLPNNLTVTSLFANDSNLIELPIGLTVLQWLDINHSNISALPADLVVKYGMDLRNTKIPKNVQIPVGVAKTAKIEI